MICTLDTPVWYYRLVYGQPSHKAMKSLTMGFVGIKTTGITTISPIRLSKEKFRSNWLKKVEKLGNTMK